MFAMEKHYQCYTSVGNGKGNVDFETTKELLLFKIKTFEIRHSYPCLIFFSLAPSISLSLSFPFLNSIFILAGVWLDSSITFSFARCLFCNDIWYVYDCSGGVERKCVK